MVRVLGIFALAVIAFAGTIIGSLALNQRLNMESINQLLGRETVEKAAPEEDLVGPWAARLRAEEQRLEAWEATLEEQETRMGLRQQQIEETLRQAVEAQEQLNQNLDEIDLAKEERTKEVAKSVENMDEDEAALTLGALPPESSARLLRIIEKGQRGKILDAMDQEYRVLVLQLMEEMA